MSLRQCEVCGRTEFLPFKCNYCGKSFCSEHHLPEAHGCPSLPKRGVHVSEEVLSEPKSREEGGKKEKGAKMPEILIEKNWTKKKIIIPILLFLIMIGCVFFYVFVDWSPPTIKITSPKAQIYSIKTIDLTYTVNKSTFWSGYSLDGQANITISRNTTLTGMSDGIHSIIIYASNIINTVSSNMVYFTIDNTPPTITIISPEKKHIILLL